MPIITISRGSCSGGALLAEELHERLGWKVLSQEDVSSAAAKAYRMTEQELFRGLYRRGIIPFPSLYESTAHTEEEIDYAVEAFGEALREAYLS